MSNCRRGQVHDIPSLSLGAAASSGNAWFSYKHVDDKWRLKCFIGDRLIEHEVEDSIVLGATNAKKCA